MTFRKVLPPAITLFLLIAGWQVYTGVSGIDAWLLPSPKGIWDAAVEQRDVLGTHTLATLELTLYGLAAGVAAGVLIAVVLHLVPVLRAALYPLLVISQNVPIIALAPLLVIWLGFGLAPKIVVIVLVCFFPVAVATLDGLGRSDPSIADYLLMSGASRWQLFTKLQWPNALPAMFSGLRIAATYSVFGAIISEWLGSEKGIGRYMILQKSAFRADRMFVAIAVVVVLALGIFGLVALLEKLTVRGRRNA
ncbi:ABC transporter permease [Actinoplanes regularis]|uniref:ABC-type nitrate/sulfonate/bicarbonate transport system, permease component n=1 Tax=Actinoplanes regularis TaxID=52697 RepID=A0A238WAR7_9ACTN|nr:ABC transporter permease [Actinoplanes regularis]GIE85163.1 nitrate ABC transporter permease [Actinoplanes regularis]SNR42799.1 ABC-type nitrate/sulfonate/bicarbonate transport system, permease component [Actinoplanes regularis]